MNASIEMPKYQCHKKVWALKINGIEFENSASPKNSTYAKLHFENKSYLPISVDISYLNKHNPEIGGYFVVYEDGYKSFSPADAFEGGYTLI